MASIRAKIRAATDRTNVGKALQMVVRDLNPILRGWGNHFRYGNSTRKFAAIDSYVHQRLAILASRKHGLRGINWGTPVQLGVARAPRGASPQRNGALQTCACLTVNDVGEPCAGEPHARFDGGAEDDA